MYAHYMFFEITLLSRLKLTLIIATFPSLELDVLTLPLDFIAMNNEKIKCNITIFIVQHIF